MDYLMLPWVMAIVRYDRVQSTADFLNQIGPGQRSECGQLLFSGWSHAQPGYTRRTVPDSRQHQGFV